MILVFDTNSLYNYLLLDHPLFQMLTFYGTDFGITVAFPEVVVEECVRHQNEKVIRAYSDLEKCIDMIERNTFDKIKWIDPRESPLHQEDWYRDNLLRRVDQLGFLVPSDSIKVSSILNRCQLRRRPFFEGKDDKGFKDALLWESILGILKDHDDELVFVTDDNQFYKRQKDSEAHQHLQDDLLRINAKNRVTFERSLSSILDRHIWSRLEKSDELSTASLDPNSESFSIPKFLKSFTFSSLFLPGEITPDECLLPSDSERIQLTNWTTISIGSPTVYLLKNGKKLYIFEAEGACVVYYRPQEPQVGRTVMMDEKNSLMHVQPMAFTIPMNLKEKRICNIKSYITVDEENNWNSYSGRLLSCRIPPDE